VLKREVPNVMGEKTADRKGESMEGMPRHPRKLKKLHTCGGGADLKGKDGDNLGKAADKEWLRLASKAPRRSRTQLDNSRHSLGEGGERTFQVRGGGGAQRRLGRRQKNM